MGWNESGQHGWMEIFLIMCTKKTLYLAGGEGRVSLRARERGGKLNFAQICYTTDCVREVANRLNMPMASAIGVLRERGAFIKIYREARKREQKSARVMARELLTT